MHPRPVSSWPLLIHNSDSLKLKGSLSPDGILFISSCCLHGAITAGGCLMPASPFSPWLLLLCLSSRHPLEPQLNMLLSKPGALPSQYTGPGTFKDGNTVLGRKSSAWMELMGSHRSAPSKPCSDIWDTWTPLSPGPSLQHPMPLSWAGSPLFYVLNLPRWLSLLSF